MTDTLAESDGFDAMLPDEVRARVKAELVPGERVLWIGRPSGTRPNESAGCLATGLCIGVPTFLLAGVSFAAFFASTPARPVGDGVLMLGIGCGAIGAIVLIGTTIAAISNRRDQIAEARNCYAVTDRRALLWISQTASAALAVRSVERGRVAGLHRVERAEGTGDVVIDLASLTHDRSYYQQSLTMSDISDVRTVEDLVRRTLVVPGALPDRPPFEEPV